MKGEKFEFFFFQMCLGILRSGYWVLKQTQAHIQLDILGGDQRVDQQKYRRGREKREIRHEMTSSE